MKGFVYINLWQQLPDNRRKISHVSVAVSIFFTDPVSNREKIHPDFMHDNHSNLQEITVITDVLDSLF
jgi:hypothetical protein